MEKINLNRIDEVLNEMSITQIELSKRIGMSAQSVNKICLNRAQPSLKRLHEIADALKIDVRRLIEPNEKANSDSSSKEMIEKAIWLLESVKKRYTES